MIAYIHYLAREENIRPFCTGLHRSKRLRRVFNHSRTRLMLIAIALYARVCSTFNSWSTFAASSCPLIIVVIGSMRFVSFNCERCSAYGLPFFYHLFKTDDIECLRYILHVHLVTPKMLHVVCVRVRVCVY